MITIIAAIEAGGGIGKDNEMPWHLPEDFAHFRRTTMGHPIIMGSRTFESIGRPLSGRSNIVLSRTINHWDISGVIPVRSLEQALSACAGMNPFIIGGAQVYEQAMGLADRLIITHIKASFDCDAFFPAIGDDWIEVAREDHQNKDLGYAFVTYNRRPLKEQQ